MTKEYARNMIAVATAVLEGKEVEVFIPDVPPRDPFGVWVSTDTYDKEYRIAPERDYMSLEAVARILDTSDVFIMYKNEARAKSVATQSNWGNVRGTEWESVALDKLRRNGVYRIGFFGPWKEFVNA